MTETAALQGRAADLRTAFDRRFAAAPRTEDQLKQHLIAIRIGTEPFALRLAEVAGLFADRKVTRVPGGHTTQLGIAGFRGMLVPVFSLPMVFAYAPGSAPRWLVIAAAAPVALAFDELDGHLSVPAAAILPRQGPAPKRGMAPEFVRAGDQVRPLIHLASVIDALGGTEALKLNRRSGEMQ